MEKPSRERARAKLLYRVGTFQMKLENRPQNALLIAPKNALWRTISANHTRNVVIMTPYSDKKTISLRGCMMLAQADRGSN